ncbi:hypothetical protein R3X25_03235 [Lutibacter sp. TH_r2]|nr:hypothetical protein [Lutibacter sp. TH_r2]MDV7186284.1 hypothetical protein [Lutibacter sp. TH_r2]
MSKGLTSRQVKIAIVVFLASFLATYNIISNWDVVKTFLFGN